MAGFYEHGNELSSLRFEASTAVKLRIRVLWDVALCLWVRNSLSVPQSLQMKALRSFETWRHFNPAPRHRTRIPEPSEFWTHIGGDCLRELRNYWHRKKDSKTVVLIPRLPVCPNNTCCCPCQYQQTPQALASVREAPELRRDRKSPALRDFC